MVKVVFEDIEKSYYDTKLHIVHVRQNFKNNQELAKILSEEFTHAVIQNRFLNTWWEFRFIIADLILMVLVFTAIYHWDILTAQTNIKTCLTTCKMFYNISRPLMNITFP